MTPPAPTKPPTTRHDLGGAGDIGAHIVKRLQRRCCDVVIYVNYLTVNRNTVLNKDHKPLGLADHGTHQTRLASRTLTSNTNIEITWNRESNIASQPAYT